MKTREHRRGEMSGKRRQCPCTGGAHNLEGRAMEVRGCGGLSQREPFPSATLGSFSFTLRAMGMGEVS